MRRLYLCLILAGIFLIWSDASACGQEAKQSSKQALQQFNDLIGEWKGTGIPKSTSPNAKKGFWIETMDWSWRFKEQDSWLVVRFTKGRYYTKGELRYLPEKERYLLKLQTVDMKIVEFEGQFANRRLTLQRTDAKTQEVQKLVIRLLHSNRFLYQYGVLPKGKTLFKSWYQVGATKQGVAFAAGDGNPECIVSGGLGTMPVMYQDKTYYVCCSGCRDEFEANAAKYVKKFEEKRAK